MRSSNTPAEIATVIGEDLAVRAMVVNHNGQDERNLLIERFKREGYTREASAKAFMYARALAGHQMIVCVSGVAPEELEQMFMIPAPSFQEAVDKAAGLAGKGAEFLVIPHASGIIPMYQA